MKVIEDIYDGGGGGGGDVDDDVHVDSINIERRRVSSGS